jgi:hypothetical protein
MGFSLMPLGGLLLGALADRLGAAPAVWLGSGVYLGVIAWITLVRPVLRRLDGRVLGEVADTGEAAGRPVADPGTGARRVSP